VVLRKPSDELSRLFPIRGLHQGCALSVSVHYGLQGGAQFVKSKHGPLPRSNCCAGQLLGQRRERCVRRVRDHQKRSDGGRPLAERDHIAFGPIRGYRDDQVRTRRIDCG